MNKVALLFPGQGSQNMVMLDLLSSLPGYTEKYEMLCQSLGFDLNEYICKTDTNAINSNIISSALTVLASVLSLQEFNKTSTTKPEIFSGYSIGQWTALYAAGMLNYQKLIELIIHRARLMDKCTNIRPGGMLAVIGLDPEPLQSLCDELSSAEKVISISNYNCYGQYTLSGDLELIDLAQTLIMQMSPKKLARIPVSGAWHSPILAEASLEFEKYLQNYNFDQAKAQIVDNVTGNYIDTDPETLRATLSRHISHPVQWHKGILRLLSDGVTEFIEIGYGNTLTKFGMFIDRSVNHRTFFPSQVKV